MQETGLIHRLVGNLWKNDFLTDALSSYSRYRCGSFGQSIHLSCGCAYTFCIAHSANQFKFELVLCVCNTLHD